MIIRPVLNKYQTMASPQFTRSRQAFRAPIRSEAWNLEDHQFSFDIYNLNAKMITFRNTFEANDADIFG